MGLAIYEGARGRKFVCDSDRGFGDWVALVSRNADAPIISCAREEAAEPLLDELGLMSQRQLRNCDLARRTTGKCPPSCNGNCNPANPPGRSTHERRNDGVAYPQWPAFVRLPVWGRGIDVQRDRVPAFIAEARKQGGTVTLTYPGVFAESQHVNLRKKPIFSLWNVRPVKLGSAGPRAVRVIQILKFIHAPDGKPYLARDHKTHGKITPTTVKAIKRWQADHHQVADGEVGLHTIRGLRAQKRRHRLALRATPTQLSPAGRDLLIKFEGLRLDAYRLPGEQFWTIGVGHYGSDVGKNQRITRAEALELLRGDVSRFERAVASACVQAGFKPNSNEFDALVSFAFNLGPGVLDRGRSMGDAIHTRNRTKIAAAFSLYTKDSRGVALEGLVRRREAEKALFLKETK